MLKTIFDFKLASYNSLEEVNLEEVLQADIIEIRGFVKGGIYQSNSSRWLGDLGGVTVPKEFIRSKKERKVLNENKLWFEQKGYHFEVLPVTQTLFDEFHELYKETTLKRERPVIFSLKEQILTKVMADLPVYLIGMFKGKKLESGLVFSISSNNQAVVSFGAKKKFDERRGGVGGVLELLLIEFCLEHSIPEISHGKAVNPVGLLSKLGLFEFKARYGFSAFPEGHWKTTFIVNPEIALSDMLFLTIIQNQIGYLVVSDEPEEAVLKKYKTKEVRLVKQVSRRKVQLAAKKFIRQLKKEKSSK